MAYTDSWSSSGMTQRVMRVSRSADSIAPMPFELFLMQIGLPVGIIVGATARSATDCWVRLKVGCSS